MGKLIVDHKTPEHIALPNIKRVEKVTFTTTNFAVVSALPVSSAYKYRLTIPENSSHVRKTDCKELSEFFKQLEESFDG